MKITKSKIIIMMCAVLCIMAVGYAAFSTVLTITGTANIASEWKVVFTKIEQVSKTSGVNIKSTPVASGTTATFNVGLTSPGDKIEYKITIENQGNIDAVIENIKATETGNDAIVFKISNIKIGDVLEGETSTIFNITIEYNSSVTSQPENLNNNLTITIDYVQYVGQNITSKEPEIEGPILLSTAIFRDNIAYADNTSSPYVTASTGIDFGQISSDTNGKGLYYTSTNTEGSLQTYYFRGVVENNYVKFGKDSSGNDILWRIIRINEDGSIRIVTQDSVGTSKFNANDDDNAYVGYMYGATGQSGNNAYNLTHSNDNPSTIKTYLDDWYVNKSNLSSYSSYLADVGFCNDRSVAPSAGLWYSDDTALGYAKNKTYYGATNRLADIKKWKAREYAQPQFKCQNEDNDLYTTSNSTKGNKNLTNSIGLLTVDEVSYAGGVYFQSNENMYLCNGSNYWTMTPHIAENSASICTVRNSGSIDGIVVSFSLFNMAAVRPVINLKSTVEITSGDGTSGNPYIIK